MHMQTATRHETNSCLQGPPFKPALRVLAERHLKRIIQQGEHDSVIDAQAAMNLVQLKIAKGPAFGTFSNEEQGDKLMDVLHAHQRRCMLVDRHDMLNRHVTGELPLISSCLSCTGHFGQVQYAWQQHCAQLLADVTSS